MQIILIFLYFFVEISATQPENVTSVPDNNSSVGILGRILDGNSSDGIKTDQVLNKTTNFTMGAPPAGGAGRGPGMSPKDLETYVKITRTVFWIRITLVFGSVVFNTLNVIVWSQKDFEKSSTSVFLIGLSATSLFASVSYIPVVIWEAFDRPVLNSAFLTKFMLLMYTLFKAGSSADSWATTALAFERWIAVAMPTKASIICTVKRARITLVTIVVAAVILNSQTMIRLTITEVWSPLARTTRVVFAYTEFGQNPVVNAIVKWGEALLNSFLPLIAIVYCNIDMMRKVKDAFAIRKTIASNYNEEEQRNQMNLARILTAIVIFSVLYHLSFTISLAVVAINPGVRRFLAWQVFISTGSLFKYLNLTVNFFLYNVFSSRFRKALENVLACKKCKRGLSRWSPQGNQLGKTTNSSLPTNTSSLASNSVGSFAVIQDRPMA